MKFYNLGKKLLKPTLSGVAILDSFLNSLFHPGNLLYSIVLIAVDNSVKSYQKDFEKGILSLNIPRKMKKAFPEGTYMYMTWDPKFHA